LRAHFKSAPLRARLARVRSALASAIPAALFAVCATMTATAEAPAAKEHELKAAYIYNFAKFTTWPATSFSSPTAPLVVGIIGNEPVATALASQVKSRTVNGHSVEVRALAANQSIADLHILYAADDASLASLQQALATPGLLTIGETARFAARGGIIRFVIDRNHLQFEINSASAKRLDLSLSSQLLMLARTVSK
jgi:hypothetical protein